MFNTFCVIIQKCLEYYDMDSEKVINMIFENILPPELTQYDYNLPTLSQHNTDTHEENATGFDPSYKGYLHFIKKSKINLL